MAAVAAAAKSDVVVVVADNTAAVVVDDRDDAAADGAAIVDEDPAVVPVVTSTPPALSFLVHPLESVRTIRLLVECLHVDKGLFKFSKGKIRLERKPSRTKYIPFGDKYRRQ